MRAPSRVEDAPPRGAARLRLPAIPVPDVLRGREAAAALALLALVQWAAILAFALTVRRNGWLLYQGGDQIWHYTTAWLLADGQLPFTTVGYAWPFVLLPVAAAAGANFLDGLPAVLLLNVLVLMPATLVALYALAARLGGRAVGLGAAALWVAGPWVAVPLFEQDYHEKYVEQFLPQVTGLTAMSDLPSTVALVVAALLTVRALDHDDAWAGVAAGLLAGVALGVKPSVGLALPAFALALAVAGRWRALVGAFGGLALPVLVLVVWKARGVGSVPLLEPASIQVAAGGVLAPVERYVDWSFDHLHQIERDLRGEFFSARLLEVVGLVGIVGLARRTVAGAILVGGWFWLIVLVKGGSSLASIDSGSFFRYVMPAYPAFCILAAALLLLVPGVGRRLLAAVRPQSPSRRVSVAVAAATAVALGAVLATTLAATQLRGDIRVVKVEEGQPLIPIVGQLQPTISADGRRITLRWRATEPTSARTFYRVFRSPKDAQAAPQDAVCTDEGGSVYCTLLAPQAVGETRETVFSEEPPEARRWVYRVAVAANWLDDTTRGDPIVMSEAVEVDLG